MNVSIGPRARRALIPLLLAACGSDSTGPSAEVGSVSVTTPQATIAVGGTVQLAASILSTTGSVLPGDVTWSTSDEAVASVSPSGLVTGVKPGTSVISAAAGGHSGSVTITVEAGECTGATEGSIVLGTSRTGSLDGSECILFQQGSQQLTAAGWALTITAPVRVILEMTSDDFEPFITVTDEALEILAVGYTPDGGPLARTLWEPEPGTYIIWASSAFGDPGNYVISATPATGDTCTDEMGSIAPGDTVTGTLALTDCIIEEGGFVADGWEFVLTDTATVRIDLMSDEFDAALFLVAGDSVLAFNDDASASTTNARITRSLPPGTYTIWATSYAPGETGAYELALQTVVSAQVADGHPAAAVVNPLKTRPVPFIHSESPTTLRRFP
jgi:hypothetical protein